MCCVLFFCMEIRGFCDFETGLKQAEQFRKNLLERKWLFFFGFHWLCEFLKQSKVQRGPLWCCSSDIWALQQKWHEYFMLSYFQLARRLPSVIPLSDVQLWENKASWPGGCCISHPAVCWYCLTAFSLIKLSHTGSVLTCRQPGWNQNPSSLPTWFSSENRHQNTPQGWVDLADRGKKSYYTYN